MPLRSLCLALKPLCVYRKSSPYAVVKKEWEIKGVQRYHHGASTVSLSIIPVDLSLCVCLSGVSSFGYIWCGSTKLLQTTVHIRLLIFHTKKLISLVMNFLAVCSFTFSISFVTQYWKTETPLPQHCTISFNLDFSPGVVLWWCERLKWQFLALVGVWVDNI